MKQIKALLAGIIIGILFGIWFGVNIGKDKPIFSNPFAEADIKDTLKSTGDKIIEKSGEVLEKSGKALKEQAKDAESALQK